MVLINIGIFVQLFRLAALGQNDDLADIQLADLLHIASAEIRRSSTGFSFAYATKLLTLVNA